MRGVMPQQVVRPRARLALGVHVLAAEEVGLHVHLLDVELTRGDLVVHVLVRRIEAAGVADHADQAGFLLLRHHGFGIGPGVRQRDLDLNVLAGIHAGDGLFGVHLRGGAEDHGIDIGHGQHFGQIGAGVRRAVLGGDFGSLFGIARNDRGDLYAVDVLEAVEVLFTESAGAYEGNTHGNLLGVSVKDKGRAGVNHRHAESIR